MESKDKHSLTHSYLALRKAVGWIGMLLPFVLMLGVFFLFKGDIIEKSISYYYYSKMGNVFVGAICAIALFMFFYSGYDKWDNWAGIVAGLFALGVAWFPTTQEGPRDLIGTIHITCAALFFLTLAVYSLFLFTQKDDKPTPQKLTRNKIYIICGVVMLLCIIAIVIYINFFHKQGSTSSFIFWAETITLVAFGVSWLTKGGTLYPDKKNT